MRLRSGAPANSRTRFEDRSFGDTVFGDTVFERTLVSMRRGSLRVVASGVVMLGLSACGSETPTEYSAENQEAFMAACVDAAVDGIYQQRVCLCVYEQAEATIPFDRFLEINEQLGDVEDPGLPEDLLELVSQCVIEEGDL